MKIKDLNKDLKNKDVYIKLRDGVKFHKNDSVGSIRLDTRVFIMETDKGVKIIPFENIVWMDINDKKWVKAKTQKEAEFPTNQNKKMLKRQR